MYNLIFINVIIEKEKLYEMVIEINEIKHRDNSLDRWEKYKNRYITLEQSHH